MSFSQQIGVVPFLAYYVKERATPKYYYELYTRQYGIFETFPIFESETNVFITYIYFADFCAVGVLIG